MNNHGRLENSRLPPRITYIPPMIPYPGAPDSPFFVGQNITNVYSQLCSDYDILGIGKDLSPPVVFWIFHWTYIKILIKGADWASVRSILCKVYRNDDLEQLMNSRQFLEALKRQSPTKDDDLIHHCPLFAVIFRGLVLRRRLYLYIQCQWFWQGLPETILMEMFCRHEIDLEDDDGNDFKDLLEKALLLIWFRKRLADFVKEKDEPTFVRGPSCYASNFPSDHSYYL